MMTPEVQAEFAALVAKLTQQGIREFIENIKTGHVTGTNFHTTKAVAAIINPHKLLATTPIDTEDCGCAYGHLGFSLAGGVWSEEACDLAHQEVDLVRGKAFSPHSKVYCYAMSGLVRQTKTTRY